MNNKFVAASYKLYSQEADGSFHLEEETEEGRPFVFISGFSMALDEVENRLVDLAQGEKFSFVLNPEQAFGIYQPDGIMTMAREDFSINGHFDHENVYEGAVIFMQDKEGHEQPAFVKEVTADNVVLDLNHPLAGKTLKFEGEIMENRDATNQEIQSLLTSISEGCHCDGDCGDDCDCHHEERCGCGHCH